MDFDLLVSEYAVDRFSMETKRQLDVLDRHLAEEGEKGSGSNGKRRLYVCGDEYTIADMAIMPWILCLREFYGASEFLDLDSYEHISAWVARIRARPAVKRGLRVNGWGENFGPPVKNRHPRADFD